MHTEVPVLTTDELSFFAFEVDDLVADLRTELADGHPLSIEDIAEHYVALDGLTADQHALGMALMLATAVVRLVNLPPVRGWCGHLMKEEVLRDVERSITELVRQELVRQGGQELAEKIDCQEMAMAVMSGLDRQFGVEN